MSKSAALLPPPTITSLHNVGNTKFPATNTFCLVPVHVLSNVDPSPLKCVVPGAAEGCRGGSPAVLPLRFVTAAGVPTAVP